MKKLLAMTFMAALTINIANAGAISNAIKTDANNTKKALQQSIKADVQNKKDTQASTAAAKKAEKKAEIDKKLTELNKELATVKADKTITETERSLKTKRLQSQIDMYTKQKAALQ